MHGLKQLVYDNQPFFSSNQTGKTNRELYILWKQNKRDDIFLLLYTQLWMVLEEVYMENVIDYYKKDCYEKKLFFELVEYQKRFFKKNIKIQLLTGYFYATTEYLFFLNKDWYHTLMHTVVGQIMLSIAGIIIFVSTAHVIRLTKPIEYRS